MASGIVVDADSHIMEPATLWQEYMDPEFRSRALRISVDEFGLEYLDIDGKVSIGYNGGTLGRIGGVDQTREWMMEHPTLPYDELKNIAPGSVDPHARIAHLDKHGVDKTFLFPTLGLGWEAECEDLWTLRRVLHGLQSVARRFLCAISRPANPHSPRHGTRRERGHQRAGEGCKGRHERRLHLPRPHERDPI